jgi:spore germination protein KB
LSGEKVRISPNQITVIIITLIISTVDIFLPNFVAREAKKDSWLSVIIAVAAVLPVVLIHLMLYRKYRESTLIEICKKTGGKVFGIFFGLSYVLYFLLISWTVTGEMSIVMNSAFLPLTPSWFFLTVSVLVSAYAVSRGIEAIARLSEILLPVGIFAFLFLFAENVKNVDFKNFLPVLSEGITPPVRGGLIIAGVLFEIIVIMQILPFASDQKRVGRPVYIGLLISGACIFAGTIIYGFFGQLTEAFLLPALEFARYAPIDSNIQSLDIFIIAIWITGIYIKIMVFYYTAVFSLAQLFSIEDYKRLVIPVGLFIYSMCTVSCEKVTAGMNFIHYIFPVYSMTMGFLIPGLMLIISYFSKKSAKAAA